MVSSSRRTPQHGACIMNFQPSLTSTAGSAGSAAPVPSCVLKQHAKAERAAVYPHVERLYLHERWKLRHVRATMEEKYHFKASPQMYKKRFANWGFRKNATYQSRQGTNTSLPLTPASTTLDACAMAFFTTVNQWTSRFFQSADFKNCLASNGVWKQGPLYPPAPSCERPALLYDPERASYAFRLVARLLRDGQGILAGRLARKAFLQIEDTMLIESPAFIWNLLDIMHAILRMGQAKLFHMLLMHLLGLANLHHDCRNHPASLIPSSLVQLMRHWSAETGVGSLVLMDHMREIVERGWLLNAGYFDARLLFLYYRLMWDSTPSALPEDKLHNVHLWFPLLADQVPVVAAELQEAKSRTCIHSVLEPAACCRIEDGTDSEPPDYERIRDSTAATLRDRYSADNVSPCVRVRIIQGLLKSRIAEGRDDKTTTMTHARANSRALRLFAKIVAFATKVLAEVDMELGGNLDVAIERWRAVIALREYGQDAHDPIVIHDLGSLEALLLKKGFEEEADNVRQEALLKDGKLRREHSNSFELREARCEPSAKRQQRVENVHPIPDKAGN